MKSLEEYQYLDFGQAYRSTNLRIRKILYEYQYLVLDNTCMNTKMLIRTKPVGVPICGLGQTLEEYQNEVQDKPRRSSNM